MINETNHGSSRPEVFCKKGALRNFTKFIGKHLCQSLLLNKPISLLSSSKSSLMFYFNFSTQNVNESDLAGYKQRVIRKVLHLRKFHLGIF